MNIKNIIHTLKRSFVTKVITFVAGLLILLAFLPLEKQNSEKDVIFKNGDIIFQTSESAQCEAVRIATKSKFSHCGIIFIENGKPMVYEAVQPVKITPFASWIKHGKNKSYLVMRLKNSDTQLKPTTIELMKKHAISQLNKDYDLYFEWSDEKIYCSELVWKIYKKTANIELCPLQKLKSFDLSHPKVKKILQQRYGANIPENELVVAPSQIVASPILETIIDTY